MAKQYDMSVNPYATILATGHYGSASRTVRGVCYRADVVTVNGSICVRTFRDAEAEAWSSRNKTSEDVARAAWDMFRPVVERVREMCASVAGQG